MRKVFIICLLLLLLPPQHFAIATNLSDVKGAFTRDGNLWLFINNEETQISTDGHIYHPQWSFDGKWLLFQKVAPAEFENGKTQSEIWVYNLETQVKKRIFYDGYQAQWHPSKNLIAFLDDGVLNVSDLKNFHNLALGVNSFTWLSDGTSFLLSSQANLKPDGWTSPGLYKKALPESLETNDLFGDIQQFFSIPKSLKVNNKNIMSISVSSFQKSPSEKWISFIVSPTGSIAMDSNMLCAISSDGKKFEILDEIIFEVGAPKWAPSKDILAYIASGGRIVFGFRGKDLKLKEFPVTSSLTPSKFAELNFTWISDRAIVTSRVELKNWSNEFSEHPLPSLYSIHISDNRQVSVTDPANGFGDYDPLYLKEVDKLLWYRGTSITDRNRNLWMADPDGSNAKLLLKNVDEIVFYEKNK